MAGGDSYSDDYDESRLRRWALGMGRKERERIQNLANLPGDGVEIVNGHERRKPRPELDEIARERGVISIPEGKGKVRTSAGLMWLICIQQIRREPTFLYI